MGIGRKDWTISIESLTAIEYINGIGRDILPILILT